MTTFQKEQKIWGTVRHLFAASNAAVSYLEVKAGFRCSRHKHMHRANLFAVVDGEIMVEEWAADMLDQPDDEHLRRTRLCSGEVLVVPSGVLHRFRVVESGHVVEVYWPDMGVDLDDIERLDVGGPDVEL